MDLKNILDVSKNIDFDSPNSELCGMCMDNLSYSCRELKCGHIFHTSCIDLWLSTNIICPKCREPLCEKVIENKIKYKQNMQTIKKNLETNFYNKNVDMVILQTGINNKDIAYDAIKNNKGDIYQAIMDLTS